MRCQLWKDCEMSAVESVGALAAFLGQHLASDALDPSRQPLLTALFSLAVNVVGDPQKKVDRRLSTAVNAFSFSRKCNCNAQATATQICLVVEGMATSATTAQQ